LQLFWTHTAQEMLARIKLETAYFEFAGRRVRVLAAEAAAPPTSGRQANVSAPGTVLGVNGDGVSVACASGGVTLLRVQPAGKTAMSGAAWANGARLPASLA
jgi:methionyl-tRNA formyltransferase